MKNIVCIPYGTCDSARYNCLRRNSFTLIELLVVIAIIAILAGMLLPALKSARDLSKTTVCIGQMKDFGTASMMYADDQKCYFPDHGDGTEYKWTNHLSTYLGYKWDTKSTINTTSIYHCPAGTVATWAAGATWTAYLSLGYGYNRAASDSSKASLKTNNLMSVQYPSNTILLTDLWNPSVSGQTNVETYVFTATQGGQWIFNSSTQLTYMAYRHNKKINVTFADGHVETCGKSGTYLVDSPSSNWAPAGTRFYNIGTLYK